MNVIHVRQGRDIKLAGPARQEIHDTGIPDRVAIQPPDFPGLRLRLLVREDDQVKVGTPLFEDKTNPKIKIVSPASGRVSAINRGEKRALLEVVVEADGSQQALARQRYSADEVSRLSREDLVEALLEGGFWPCIRQRPFSNVAHPSDVPKSIFVQAINTEPLALDVDVVLRDRQEEFQFGLDVLRKLTKGDVHVCFSSQAQAKALTEAKNVKTHGVEGPHPAGNVSTLVHFIDPINKGDIVWYLRAEDVLRIAPLLLEGTFSPEKYAAVTGEGAQNRVYKKTIIGAPILYLLEKQNLAGYRCISGSVLAGKNVGANGFLCFYDSQVTVIPEGGKREFLGWLSLGFNKYSFSRTFLSSVTGQKEISLDADRHGDHRAIVLNHIYDDYVPLDIPVYFLLRAVIAGDIEEAEKLGILECDEEDFALCTFACPSKTDVGGIIRNGLQLIEREG